MTIIILPSAKEDLAEGFRFFERQQPGLGTYFLESLFSDIDSLRIYAGVHRRVFGYHRLLSKRFTFAAYYSWSPAPFMCKPFWIAGETPAGSASGWGSNAFSRAWPRRPSSNLRPLTPDV